MTKPERQGGGAMKQNNIKFLNLHLKPSREIEGYLQFHIELVVNERAYNSVELIHENEIISTFDMLFNNARDKIKEAIMQENPIEKELIAGVNSKIQ